MLVPTRPFRGTHSSRNACSSTAPTPASGPTRIPPIVATAAVRGRPQDGLRPRRPELLQAHAAGGAVRRRGRHAALAGGRERAQRLADVQALQRQLRPRAVREARHGRAALVCGHLDQLPAEAHVRWSLARTRACTAPDVRSTRVSGPDTAAALVICCLVSAQATVCVTNTLTWEPDALSFAALQVRHPEAHKLTAPDASGTVGRPAAVVSRTGGSARGPLIRRAAGGGRAAQPAQAAAHARLQRRAAAAAGRRHARGHAAQLRQQLHGHRARQQLQQLACLAVCALVGAVDTRVEGVKTCA